jgi:hypothetical protein
LIPRPEVSEGGPGEQLGPSAFEWRVPARDRRAARGAAEVAAPGGRPHRKEDEMKAKLVKVLERKNDSSTIEVEVTMTMKLEIREGRNAPNYEIPDILPDGEIPQDDGCFADFASRVLEAVSDDPLFVEEVDRIHGY